MATDIDHLRSVFSELTEMHGWAPLQTPRNMTLALTTHVGAIASHLQFASDEDVVTDPPAALRTEIGDCLVYLLALGDALGTDLVDEAVQNVQRAVDAGRAAQE